MTWINGYHCCFQLRPPGRLRRERSASENAAARHNSQLVHNDSAWVVSWLCHLQLGSILSSVCMDLHVSSGFCVFFPSIFLCAVAACLLLPVLLTILLWKLLLCSVFIQDSFLFVSDINLLTLWWRVQVDGKSNLFNHCLHILIYVPQSAISTVTLYTCHQLKTPSNKKPCFNGNANPFCAESKWVKPAYSVLRKAPLD